MRDKLGSGMARDLACRVRVDSAAGGSYQTVPSADTVLPCSSEGRLMTNPLPDGRLTRGEFRVGHVFSLAWSVFARNFFKFTIISAITFLPFVPLIVVLRRFAPADLAANANVLVTWLLVGAAAAIFLSLFCQAILLHAAFQ